jgi:hypothetical protein
LHCQCNYQKNHARGNTFEETLIKPRPHFSVNGESCAQARPFPNGEPSYGGVNHILADYHKEGYLANSKVLFRLKKEYDLVADLLVKLENQRGNWQKEQGLFPRAIFVTSNGRGKSSVMRLVFA